MFGLCFVSLAVAALLFGTANAAPAPVYNPKFGEIVHVSPEDTTGASLGTGVTRPHPHIALGNDQNGNLIVAPVTHNSQSDHLKPHMPAPNEHTLDGIVRLDHTVVTRPEGVSRSGGAMRGKVVSHAALQEIQGAKALVGAHYDAAHHHSLAAQEHRGHEAYHDAQSAAHFQAGRHELGTHHATLAAVHRGHAENHEISAANHHAAAKVVNGPDHAQRQAARHSAAWAKSVHSAFAAERHHNMNGHALAAQGRHEHANAAFQQAAAAHHHAMTASPTAIHHANLATAHLHTQP